MSLAALARLTPIWCARSIRESSMRAVLDQATHSLSMTFQLGVMAWSWCSD